MFEKRGTATASPATRAPPGATARARAGPTSPPIQIEPPTRCSQSSATDEAAGRGLRGVAGEPGTSRTARRGEPGADQREQLGDRAPFVARAGRCGSRAPAAATKSAKQIHRSTSPRPNAETRTSGTIASELHTERRAKSAVEIDEVDRNRDEADARSDCERDRDAPQGRARRRAARRDAPIASRSAASPIAHITDRKTTQRAMSRRGVAAVSEIDGITNCGAGPGFGPTANVNAPRTGWPSTEIARQ